MATQTITQPAVAATPTSNPTSAKTLDIRIEFTGGLEMLFSNKKKHDIQMPAANSKTGSPSTIADLINFLCDNLMDDPRKDLFVLEDTVRPGILVLINDADWELEGEANYQLEDGDEIVFVSTLHGG